MTEILAPHEVPDAHRAEMETALEHLTDAALDPIVDMVCTYRDGVYEAHLVTADGARVKSTSTRSTQAAASTRNAVVPAARCCRDETSASATRPSPPAHS